MNKQRRKDLERAIKLLNEAEEIVTAAADDELDYFADMPEAFQDSDRGRTAEETADTLAECATEIQGARDKVQERIDL